MCPVEGCDWKSAGGDTYGRKRDLAAHINETHASDVDETAAMAHGLFVCKYCKLVMHRDPTFDHEHRTCEGQGAPIMSDVEWERCKPSEHDRQVRSRAIARIQN